MTIATNILPAPTNALGRLLGLTQAFFSTWRFPALGLSLVLSFKFLVLGVLLIPVSNSTLGQFAEEFKVWCFGLNPETGKTEPGYVALAVLEPLVLGSVFLAVWHRQLRGIWRERRMALVPYVLLSASLVAVAALSLFGMRDTARAGKVPFPARELRTDIPFASFALTNHEGEAFSVAAHRGKVVMLTGVYATCGFTCPTIMGQAKRVVSELAEIERRDLIVAAVTLDPENDNQANLKKMADGQSVRAPLFSLLWGAPKDVNPVLDALEITRSRNPETGVIDHANLFVLLDRKGNRAYRFTLGDLQEKWMLEAIRILLREAPPS